MATPIEEVDARPSVSGSQAALLVLGLVLVLIVLWFVFLRGSPEETVALTPPVTTPVAPAPEETSAPVGKPGKGAVETFEVFAPKDPFRPLISTGTGTGTAAAPATTGTTTDTTGTGTGTGQPSGGSDISNDNGSDVGGHRVRLIDTFRSGGEDRARVQVDGTVYTVGEGDRFAENFEVVSISGSCASLLFGDDQFSLCEGEEILK
ncbi:MAG: hypothetical protein QOG04_2287 [Actinomycetota bacterium]|jgi:hypothetical protein|nr:hypothetical protein [Actinomycetota bacterium]